MFKCTIQNINKIGYKADLNCESTNYKKISKQAKTRSENQYKIT